MTSSDRVGFGIVVAALLCCAAPVLIGTGLAAAALGVVRQHWGWFGAGVATLAVAAWLRRRRLHER